MSNLEPTTLVKTQYHQPILVRYRNKAITATDIEFIKEQIALHPGMGRTPLSMLLCELWDWRSPTGKLKDFACRDLLLRLEEWGYLQLPQRQHKTGQKNKVSDINLELNTEPIEGSQDLNKLVVRPVSDRNERLMWRALMEQHHYLGEGVMCGEHLLYVVYLNNRIVACLGWGAAALRSPKRDTYLGWDFNIAKSELYQVTNNLRFLILPWVKVQNLGSRILSLNLKRLNQDWQTRYGHELILAETFVDTSRFHGTVYKAANWIYLGHTAGKTKRGNQYSIHGNTKAIFVYPLKDHRKSKWQQS